LTASPSYAECVFGKVDIKANKGDKQMIGEKTYTIKGYLCKKKNNKFLPLHILSSLRINE
jgi:hypothetical protein